MTRLSHSAEAERAASKFGYGAKPLASSPYLNFALGSPWNPVRPKNWSLEPSWLTHAFPLLPFNLTRLHAMAASCSGGALGKAVEGAGGVFALILFTGSTLSAGCVVGAAAAVSFGVAGCVIDGAAAAACVVRSAPDRAEAIIRASSLAWRSAASLACLSNFLIKAAFSLLALSLARIASSMTSPGRCPEA